MPKGIVRAADRVAVWHQAAEEDWEQQLIGEIPQPPATSTPPQGVPSPAGVAPKSNKFVIPANGLKKVMETSAHPSEGFHPQSTTAFQGWADKQPAFVKTYFKPQYQEALKGHLGEENYAKLLHHAPTPFTDALTTYAQKPAPNSNKFNIPANGLKKLLADPNTTPKHVEQWIDKHPSFHGYLGPQYSQALKGVLGKDYESWKEHLSPKQQAQVHQDEPELQAAEQQKQAPYSSGPLLADLQKIWPKAMSFGDAGHHDPEVDKQVLQGLMSSWKEKQPELQALHDKYFGQPQHGEEAHEPAQSYEDAWKKLFPGAVKAPPQEKLEKVLSSGSLKAKGKHDAVQALYDKYFGSGAAQDQSSDQDQISEIEKLLEPVGQQSAVGEGDPDFQEWAQSVAHDKEHTEHGKSPEQLWEQWQQATPEDKADALGYLKSDYYKDQLQKQQPDIEKALSEAAPPGLSNGIKKIFPQSGLDPYATTGEVKQQLESWLKYLPDHEGFASHVPQLQALYDQYFGQGGEQQPTPEGQPEAQAFNHKDFFNDYAKAFQHKSPHSLALWMDHKNSSPEEIAQALSDKITAPGGVASKVPALKELYQKYFGDQSSTPAQEPQQPSAPITFNQDKFWKDYGAIYGKGDAPHELATYQSHSNDSPEQIAKFLKFKADSWKGTSKGKKFQKVYDDHFGSGAQQSQQVDPFAYPGASWAGVDSNLIGSLPSGFMDWDKHKATGENILQPGVAAFLESQGYGPDELKKLPYHAVDQPNQVMVMQDWQALPQEAKDQFIAQEQEGQGKVPEPAAPSNWDGDKFVKEYKSIFPGTALAGMMADPVKAKKKLETLLGDGYGGTYSGEKKTKVQDLYDKWFGLDQEQSGGGSTSGSAPFNALAIAQGMQKADPHTFDSDWVNSVKNNSPQEFKSHLEGLLKGSYPAKEKVQYQGLLDKYFGDGASAQSTPDGGPVAQEQGDSDAIIADITNEWPASGAGLKGKSLPEIKEQLLHWMDSSKGYSTGVTQKAKGFYDKYFGGEEDPEEEEVEDAEPAKPFKSEPLNPDDINHWAQNKPQDPAQWKAFAQWWGATQMPPEAETGLYKQWFGKDVPPEQAQNWFQQVFEHNSAPGEGDLGIEGVPGWAQNSWALGSKAEEEWPVFKAWATQHPGIPKGTSLKQKLAIWKGLSAQDKAQIAGDYAPANPIDTKSVVNALKAAYPDSDWSKWAKMPQGTLQKSLESLGKAGYGPAAQVYNQFFGGNLPVPEEPAEGEQAPSTEQPLPPVSALPAWLQPQMEGKGPGSVAKLTKDYLNLKKFADSVGQGDQVTGDFKPDQIGKLWQKLPAYIKAQINQMDTLPWQDMDSFEQWKEAQPDIKDVIQEAMPDWKPSTFPWTSPAGSYDSNKQQGLAALVDKTTDPETKQKLLGIYQEYYGHGKSTLGESLKQIDPNTDWDKILQSKSKSQVMSLLKKQLKTEQDPVKWAQLANVWLKHFPHPDDKYKPAPVGIKALNGFLKYQSPGSKLNADQLAQLYDYKLKNPANQNDYVPYHYGKDPEHQKIGEQLAALDDGKAFLPYLGWTPPSGASMGSYKADPSLYGNPGKSTTYTAPEESKGSVNYQKLTQKADALKHLFSDKDRAVLKSDGFRNWFNKAPQNYRSSLEANPGIALDDYESFMSGGSMYPDAPEASKGKDKYYDVTPFALTPTKGKDIPREFVRNPKRWDEVKFPHHEDVQETLPLPGGEKWAPQYAAMPIYRIMNVDLDRSDHPAPSHITNAKDRELFNQQQIARLRRIDQLVNGTTPIRNPQNDLKYLQNWGNKYGLDPKEVQEVASVMFGEQPDLFTDDKWKHLEDFARQKGIDPAEMHDLANKLEVTPPPDAKGNYEHPELAQLLLDYMESNQHRSSEGGSGSQGGLGWHWTRDKDKVYNGIPAAGEGALVDPSRRRIPVAISGLWGGQGEGSGHGGAYDPDDKRELEHNLRSHAPVHIRRLQIRSPDKDWHDLIDYGPMSLWSPGRNETATGKTVLDKPSLARELDKTLGGKHNQHQFDTLVPGYQADAVFAKLVHEHPEQKDQLLKLYRDFFVGRPELPTKPHTRRASVQHIPHLAALDERNPRHLYDLAVGWGIQRPERYGLPYLKELASDLKGVGWHAKEVVKEHGLGKPNPRRQPTVASLEAQIMRMAGIEDMPSHVQKPHWLSEYDGYGQVPGEVQDHWKDFLNQLDDDEVEQYSDPAKYGWEHGGDHSQYSDDYQNAWESYLEARGVKPNWEYDEDPKYDDDYDHDDDDSDGYDDDDFEGDPPMPTMDRPKGWPQQAPWIKNDPRGRQYFPARGLNGPSTSNARPDIDWEEKVPEHPVLPIPEHEWPNDTQPTPMYRGLMLNLNQDQLGNDPLGSLRRALWGGKYEVLNDSGKPAHGSGPTGNKALAQPHPLGFNNPGLGEHILNHVETNPQAYEGHQGYGLGPHWSTNEQTAKDFAKGTTLGGDNHPLKLPTVIRSQWKGLGEDPYRTNTQGDWPEENEVTMLPGAKMHIDSVKIQHPHTGEWHEVLGQPTTKHAQKSTQRQPESKVEVRRPRGILTHSEMRS